MGIIQRDSFRITLIAFAGATIGYLNKVFLFPNFLMPDQVGLANLMITLALIYAQVASLGSGNIIVRFFPFFNDSAKNHHGFLFAISAFSLAGFTLVSLLVMLLRQPFYQFYAEGSPLLVEYFWYLVPLALATLYFNLFDAYLRSLFRNVFPSLVYEIGLRLFITLSVLLFALDFVNFEGFVVVYVVANCLPAMLVILYTVSIRQLKLKPDPTPLLKRLSGIMFNYGGFSVLNNLSFLILASIDALMIAGMIDLAAAGIYTTMVFVTSVMLIPYRSMLRVSGPIVAQLWRLKDLVKMDILYKKASSGNLVVGAGLFLLLWINIDSLFQFMPLEYALGKFVFLYLGIGRLVDMAAGLNGAILLTSRRFKIDLLFTTGLIVFTILSNLALIPRFGINGAAMASMASLILFNIFRIVYLYRQFQIHPFVNKQLFVPPILLAIILISSLSGRLDNVFADIAVRSLVAGLAFCIPIYFLRVSEDLSEMVNSTTSTIRKKLRRR